jgi:ABC-type glycerol-3-phosphate transport system substrate-binding protein
MEVQGPWLANVINAFKPEMDYGVAPFPVTSEQYDAAAPVGLIDTDILVIPRGVKHPEASMEFIAYTQRPEVVEYLSTVHCKNSPLAVSSETFLDKHPNKGVRVHDAIAKSPRAYVCPRTRTWLQFKEEFDAAAEHIWTLTSPAKAELGALQGRTQALLDRAADQRRRRAALVGDRA